MIIEAKVYQTVTLCLKLCQALHALSTGSPAKSSDPQTILFPTWTSGSAKVQRACKLSLLSLQQPQQKFGQSKDQSFLGNVRELRLKDKQLPQHIETQAHRKSLPDHLPGAEATRTINWKEHLVVILMDR